MQYVYAYAPSFLLINFLIWNVIPTTVSSLIEVVKNIRPGMLDFFLELP
jgi:hypothetical protein